MSGSEMGAGAMLLLVVLGIALLVLWVLLPFAVFGIKDRLSSLLAEQRKTNALLEQMRQAGPAPSSQPLDRAHPGRAYPGDWPAS